MIRSAHRGGAVALALAAACATPTGSALSRSAVTWPLPPATPRVRLLAVLPDPDAPPPAAPLWRRVLAFVAGTDELQAPPPPFSRPFGVAAAPDGRIFVADPDRPSVLRISGNEATPVACAGLGWRSPLAVALAPDATLFVADVTSVIRVGADGRCSELAPGVFERASGIAISGDRLYVSDPPRHAVVVLSLAGEVVERLGGPDAGEAALRFPSAVAAAPDGSILVADTFGFSVARWKGGSYVGRVGGASEQAGGLVRPKGVAVDTSGRVFVSDAERDVVVAFSAGGEPEYSLGSTGSAPGYFAHPAGLAVAGGRVLVADSLNGRVQVFEFLGGSQ